MIGPLDWDRDSSAVSDDPPGTRDAWTQWVHARGGHVTAWPFTAHRDGTEDDRHGAPAAKYPISVPRDRTGATGEDDSWRTANGGEFYYVLAPYSVRLGLAIDILANGASGLIGTAVSYTPAAVIADALGMDEDGDGTYEGLGVTNVAAKILGVPHWLLIAVLLAAGYAAGVQLGLLPSIRQITKGGGGK